VYWYRHGFIVGGLVSVAFGVALFAVRTWGAVTLALLFGLLRLIYGVSQIVMGTEQDWPNLQPVLPNAA
jgi:uncharacterized membrane protein HdeD (DUF308 family)